MTRTQQLAEKLDELYESDPAIQLEIKNLSRTGPRGGHNARHIEGWHPSSSGTVTKAANLSKYIPTLHFWSGSARTPSTAIPSCIFYQAATAKKEIFG